MPTVRFRCSPELRFTPLRTLNFDGPFQKKLTGSRRLNAGIGLFKLLTPYPTLTSAGWMSAMWRRFRCLLQPRAARKGCLPARKRVSNPRSIKSPRSMVNTNTHAPTVTIPEPSSGVRFEKNRITACVPESLVEQWLLYCAHHVQRPHRHLRLA